MRESLPFGIALTLLSFFPNPVRAVLLRTIARRLIFFENGVESAGYRRLHANVMKGSMTQILENYVKNKKFDLQASLI
jgi:hypothetical protein